MDEMQRIVDGIVSDIEDINAELSTAATKGVFSYPRAKGIRKAAHEIAKKAKALREISLETFKATEAKAD